MEYYTPHNPQSFSELPLDIQEKVNSHLENGLGGDGSVLKEIDLPHFVKSPEKLHFHSLQEASYVAVDHGFRGDKLEASISYNEKEDALVWDFEEVTNRDFFGGKGKGISISVHTGKVIDEWELNIFY